MKKINAILLLLLIGSGLSAQVQSFPPVAIKNTELRFIESNFTNHEYEIKIYLPPSYKSEKKEYPIVYILDGDYNFGMVCYGTRHLVINKDVPEVILVGIANIAKRRQQDYTPTTTNMPASGGADQFIEFLRHELFPLISTQYRTNNNRTIVGHSLAGLFAYYCMFSHPSLFNNYLAVSPSLWYDDELLFKIELGIFSQNGILKAKMYSAVGELETKSNEMYHEMVQEHERMTQLLHNRNYSQLSLKAETLTDESHHSIFPNAFMKGMRYIFQ
ncbi:alpha/beta hydrolase [Reichenbachiella sp.]